MSVYSKKRKGHPSPANLQLADPVCVSQTEYSLWQCQTATDSSCEDAPWDTLSHKTFATTATRSASTAVVPQQLQVEEASRERYFGHCRDKRGPNKFFVHCPEASAVWCGADPKITWKSNAPNLNVGDYISFNIIQEYPGADWGSPLCVNIEVHGGADVLGQTEVNFPTEQEHPEQPVHTAAALTCTAQAECWPAYSRKRTLGIASPLTQPQLEAPLACVKRRALLVELDTTGLPEEQLELEDVSFASHAQHSPTVQTDASMSIYSRRRQHVNKKGQHTKLTPSGKTPQNEERIVRETAFEDQKQRYLGKVTKQLGTSKFFIDCAEVSSAWGGADTKVTWKSNAPDLRIGDWITFSVVQEYPNADWGSPLAVDVELSMPPQDWSATQM